MLGWFKSPSFRDPQLGEFTRSRGRWRGSLALDAKAPVPLILSGDRSEPDPQALALARALPQQLPAWRPSIEQALFEHFSPYAEALAAGESPLPSGGPLKIEAPGQVWPHVSLVYISVVPLDGTLTIELGYTTAWDEEHTLGARFRSGNLMELCGSVLHP